jgi:PLP dependent protein
VLPVLLEINAGADPGKFGATPGAAPRLLETALAKKNLRVDGLMTVAPLSDARRAFAALRALRGQLAQEFSTPLPVLSMGMSGDLAAAVAEGSTLVRIGTALFGARV